MPALCISALHPYRPLHQPAMPHGALMILASQVNISGQQRAHISVRRELCRLLAQHRQIGRRNPRGRH